MMREGFHSTRKADWVISGVPIAFFNSVTRTAFPEAPTHDIERMVAKFESVGSPMAWWVTPSTRPKDLGARLLALGFTADEPLPAMSLRLASLVKPAYPRGLVVKPVRTRAEFTKWFSVWRKVFEIPEEAWDRLHNLFLRKGWSTDSDVVNYSGYLGGRLVAISTLFLGKSAAGIYNVGTLPEARGKGIGSAMTHVALAEARDGGFEVATLQSSKAGYHIYRNLGFETCFEVMTYLKSSH